MNLTLEQYKKVQQYLDEKMTPEEEDAFIEEVSANSLLQEYLQFEIALQENLSALRSLETEQPGTPAITSVLPGQEKQEGRLVNMKAVAAIAACFIIVVIGIVWFSTNRSKIPEVAKKNDIQTQGDSALVQKSTDTSNTKPPLKEENFAALYKQYYTKELPDEKPDELYVALNDYKDGNYKTIQDLDLSHLPSKRGPLSATEKQHIRDLGYFYKGLSFIEINNNEQALEKLNWLVNNGKDKKLKEKAIWYQALIYVKQGDTNNAVDKLTFLAASKSTYSSQAKSLLQALKHS